MLWYMPWLLVFWQPQLKLKKWDSHKKKWKSIFWNKVFIIHYSLHKSVEEMLMANFCCHEAYLWWQIQQQLLFAVVNFEAIKVQCWLIVKLSYSQSVFTCSKLTINIWENSLKFVQNWQKKTPEWCKLTWTYS